MASSCRLAVCMLVTVAAPPSVAIHSAEFVMSPSSQNVCVYIFPILALTNARVVPGCYAASHSRHYTWQSSIECS
ncbi:hypothetical protein B0H19DRAFT_1159566 [Mycena capillaripes]|nr:hypothetical protein B0H19DRAFT_1159566 [Mycena capillaripes]